ncbi:MAG: sugar phosphate isomerase/epimerase, partial [Acetobacteraceae bacterium]|nr:sugar phosphate isomerase/epimerase [Acetobacteraceae bacterium]
RWDLAQCIEGCARHGIPGISPWRDKLAEMGVQRAARRIRDVGLSVTGLCRGGMFTAADKAGRRAAIDDNRRAIEEAHILGAACLVMVCGGLPPGSKDLPGAREMVRDGLHEILPEARAAGVALALEPLHPMTCADRSVLTSLAQALDLCDELGEGTGVAVDVYHVWWDPDVARQIARAGKRILAFHACDWLVPTSDLVFDRGMPGDGVIDIPRLRAMVEAAGYKGFIEVELLSRRWWAEDPEEVLRIVKERHATVC